MWLGARRAAGDVGVRRGGDRGHGVARGARGVHVPVPLRRPGAGGCGGVFFFFFWRNWNPFPVKRARLLGYKFESLLCNLEY